jgi:hypothetical protein
LFSEPEFMRAALSEIAYCSREQDPPVHYIAYLVQIIKFARFNKKFPSSLYQHSSPGT